MNYRIEFEGRALRQLKKLDPQISKRVMDKIRDLIKDPQKYPLLSGIFSRFRKIVIGTSGGEFRAIYTLDEKLRAVNIVFVGPRENFYKELQRYLGR